VRGQGYELVTTPIIPDAKPGREILTIELGQYVSSDKLAIWLYTLQAPRRPI
jgi:hypothetical protein